MELPQVSSSSTFNSVIQSVQTGGEVGSWAAVGQVIHSPTQWRTILSGNLAKNLAGHRLLRRLFHKFGKLYLEIFNMMNN